MSSSSSTVNLNKKKQEEKTVKLLRDLASLTHNKQCCDCNQKGPTYVNITLGTFVCTSCCGILRGLNPPHRMKSINMATFTQDEVDFLKTRGNHYCQLVYMSLFDSAVGNQPDSRDNEKLRDFLTQKYERKRWYQAPTEQIQQQITKENDMLLINKSLIQPTSGAGKSSNLSLNSNNNNKATTLTTTTTTTNNSNDTNNNIKTNRRDLNDANKSTSATNGHQLNINSSNFLNNTQNKSTLNINPPPPTTATTTTTTTTLITTTIDPFASFDNAFSTNSSSSPSSLSSSSINTGTTSTPAPVTATTNNNNNFADFSVFQADFSSTNTPPVAAAPHNTSNNSGNFVPNFFNQQIHIQPQTVNKPSPTSGGMQNNYSNNSTITQSSQNHDKYSAFAELDNIFKSSSSSSSSTTITSPPSTASTTIQPPSLSPLSFNTNSTNPFSMQPSATNAFMSHQPATNSQQNSFFNIQSHSQPPPPQQQQQQPAFAFFPQPVAQQQQQPTNPLSQIPFNMPLTQPQQQQQTQFQNFFSQQPFVSQQQQTPAVNPFIAIAQQQSQIVKPKPNSSNPFL